MLLDTASLYFRAFYGLPDSLRASDGTPVNAVRGMLDMIGRLVTDFAPSDLIACWDDDWRPQWRVDLLPTYKTHRVAQVVEAGPDVEVVPELLQIQVPIIVDALTALGIPILGAPGYEADDVIGTLASTASGPVDVITGDRDLFQVVDDDRDVRVIYTGSGMRNLLIVTDSVVVEKYGVHANQYADFATLRGDPSDGLPGVPGIGEKTAGSLLSRLGDMDAIIAAADQGTTGPLGTTARKITAAADYLVQAPSVVAVVRDLDLPDVDAVIGVTAEGRAHLEALRDRWNLGESVGRAVRALERAAAP